MNEAEIRYWEELEARELAADRDALEDPELSVSVSSPGYDSTRWLCVEPGVFACAVPDAAQPYDLVRGFISSTPDASLVADAYPAYPILPLSAWFFYQYGNGDLDDVLTVMDYDLLPICPPDSHKIPITYPSLISYEILDDVTINAPFKLFANIYTLQEVRGLDKLHIGSLTDLSYMFHDCKSLRCFDGIETWDTSRVRTSAHMFQNCRRCLSFPDLGRWDTSSLIDIEHMFSNCFNEKNADPSGAAALNICHVEKARGVVFNCAPFFDVCFSIEYDLPYARAVLGASLDLKSLFDLALIKRSFDTVAAFHSAVGAYIHGVPVDDIVA